MSQRALVHMYRKEIGGGGEGIDDWLISILRVPPFPSYFLARSGEGCGRERKGVRYLSFIIPKL